MARANSCIWCSRTKPSVKFESRAHTFPKSLGGQKVCPDVCDECNHSFGRPTCSEPSIEVVLKEVLNFSRYYLLQPIKNQKLPRYKSEYFNVDWQKNSMRLKPRYALKYRLKDILGRQFRRGIYKVFLEESHRVRNDGHEAKYDFIREFSRYGFGDNPIYWLVPKFGLAIYSADDCLHPELRFTESSDFLERDYPIYNYQIMGHQFYIPVSKYFESLFYQDFTEYLKKQDDPFGHKLVAIDKIERIDFTYSNLH